MEATHTHRKLNFLQGGGEMGALARAYDWEQSSIGSPYEWPQSLRTTLGILLHSAFPMFLFWGPELLCFYNDVYRPSLGDNGKHPAIGKRAKEMWPEIWDFISPLIEQTMTTGEPVWFQDQLLPIYRNGGMEDVYWTFSYSPAYGDSGEIAGVLVTCMETTKAVQRRGQLEESEGRFRTMIKDAPAGITVLRGDDFVMENVNEAMLRFINRDASIIGQKTLDAFPEIETQAVWPLLQNVYREGKPLNLHAVPVSLMQDGKLEEGYYDISYTPLKEGEKTVGILQMVQDVTQQVTQQKALAASEERFRNLVMKAPFGVAVYQGEDLVADVVNEYSLNLMGKERHELEGLPLFEAVPQIRERMEPVIRGIISDGVPVQRKEIPTRTYKGGKEELAYFNAIWTPYRDGEGKVAGVMAVGYDVTEGVLARQELERSEAKFRSMIEEAPMAKCLLVGRALVIEVANAAMIEYMGKGPCIIGKPLAEALPELEGQPFLKILDDVFTSGEMFKATAQPAIIIKDGKPAEACFDYTFKPLRNAAGEVWAIINMSVDVTERVLAQKRVEQSQRQILDSFEQSPVGIAIIDNDEGLSFRMANAFYCGLVSRRPEDLIDKPLFEALPEVKGQGFDDLLRGVMSTGVAYTANELPVQLMRNDKLETLYLDFAYQPRRDADGHVNGVLAVIIDVTQQVRARQSIEASEMKLRSVVDSAPFPIGIYEGRELRITLANNAIIAAYGKGPDVEGRLYTELLPELEGTGIYEQLRSVIDTGEPVHMRNQRVDLMQDGALREHYFNYSFTPLYDAKGAVYAVMNTAAEITDVVKAKRQIEETESALRSAVELAELATWSLDVQAGSVTYSPRFMEWLGFSSDTADLDAAYNPLPGEYRESVPAAIAAVLAPGAPGIYENEHPIVNRLTGEERIIHALAQVSYYPDGTPAYLSGMAQDVTEQRRLQQQLEQEVAERTAELAEANAQLMHSNEELAQYAYVASHDLQEPLRKIRVFSGMLGKQAGLTNESRELIGKVEGASERMALLIKDLLEFSRLLNSESLVRPIDLAEVCQSVVSDFELNIEEKDAQISMGPLPRVEGVGLHMNQLFYNLLSNALKFSKPDVPPRISIESRPMQAIEVRKFITHPNQDWLYYDITIKDNGIGFESRYTEQIFEVFKRLHGRDVYPGSGIGLALCRRIAVNAKGYLYAESAPGEGSTFHVILPDRLR